jgi:hypothetical protein
MTPAAIIRDAQAEGVTLALSPSGSIKAVGDSATVNRWLPIIVEHKPGIVVILQAANDPALPAELDRLIRGVAAHHQFTADELQEALTVAAGDPDDALVSFRLLAAEVDAPGAEGRSEGHGSLREIISGDGTCDYLEVDWKGWKRNTAKTRW